MVNSKGFNLVRVKPYKIARAGPSGGMKISIAKRSYAEIGDEYWQYYDENTGNIVLVPVRPVRIVRAGKE